MTQVELKSIQFKTPLEHHVEHLARNVLKIFQTETE